jgi:hypothetical protein
VKHIDEHILELLVLGDAAARKRERQIAKHLSECIGCRAVFDEIKAYYEEVGREESSQAPAPHLTARKSMIRKRNELEPYFAKPGIEAASYTEIMVPTIWRRIKRFSGEHPARFAFATFLSAAILSLAGNYFLQKSHGSYRPAFFNYDSANHRLEVFDSSGNRLWSRFSFDVNVRKLDQEDRNISATMVTDLDGLGQNEVLSIISDPNPPSRTLRIFDGKGRVEARYSFPDSVISFNHLHYYTPFFPQNFVVCKMRNGRRDVFLVANNGRSPSVLVRLDRNLREIGRYWHFGNFFAYLMDDHRDGVREIALVGCNDVDDMSGGRYQFLAIIDPEKVVGNRESNLSSGFGYPVSDAEIYYIRFPKTDLEIEAGHTPEVQMVERDTGDSLLQVGIKSTLQHSAPYFYGFDYLFEVSTMKLVAVKFISPTEDTYTKLKRQGKLSGTFDDKYLENLKNSVRYWDGNEWVSAPTRIKPSSVATKQIPAQAGNREAN